MDTQEKQREIQREKIEWVKPKLKTLGTVRIITYGGDGNPAVCTPGTIAVTTCYIGTSVGPD